MRFREILRVDSPVSNIIYVPHVRPPRLPWRKCRDIFVGQYMTRHKKKATVPPLPKSFGSDYRLINENHHRSYLNRVLILKPQSLWSKERSVMSSEDLKDWKEEVSIGDLECKMQPLKLSILALTIKENWKQVGIDHVLYIK